MKTLSLTQPWASLVAAGAKKIETRSFYTNVRGRVAIHASKKFPGDAKSICDSRVFYRAMGWPARDMGAPLTQEWLDENTRLVKTLPLGCVIATVNIVGCVKTERVRELVPHLSDQEEAFGNYEPGRYAWLLEGVKQLEVPVPAKGALGFWEWTEGANA